MNQKLSPYRLGATLYMPAIKDGIGDIIAGRKLAGVDSIVLCLEDALAESDIEAGLANLRFVLEVLKDEGRNRHQTPLVFVRPRNLDMARVIVDFRGIDLVDGFVAPKFRLGNAEAWLDAVEGTDLYLMPTLETAEMLDASAVAELRDALKEASSDQILALRIGGNDLMQCLGLRRTRGRTLYEGPLLYAVSMLVSTLAPAGFALTSPVMEIFEDVQLLGRELEADVAFGLVGKTAIHPSQVPIIQQAFKVSPQDLASAQAILEVDAPAVFKLDGVMIEPATHHAWARRIVERANVHGMLQPALSVVAS